MWDGISWWFWFKLHIFKCTIWYITKHVKLVSTHVLGDSHHDGDNGYVPSLTVFSCPFVTLPVTLPFPQTPWATANLLSTAFLSFTVYMEIYSESSSSSGFLHSENSLELHRVRCAVWIIHPFLLLTIPYCLARPELVFICSSVDEHLSHIKVLAITKKRFCEYCEYSCTSLCISIFFFLLNKYVGVEWLGPVLGECSIF